ncbi:adenylosuccinate lyase [Ferroglobus placidus DSM 10642]|uniref:Adenylosuccinate lyase n=1 Tax=Ferroglobus placidus (strain DSM 10642 / AEDII12DO) TaxID=589924 RepID=D3S257_FERPA|nr:adenylosuccinate lyase [Ferroglobus placidus]ADC66548.1 adenylosuccinate lyase [Ferroglobus placidus DSM 10642]
MIVHPIDYRYGTEEMKRIWSEESRIKRMIRVEIALLKALAKLGYLSEDSVRRTAEKARKITPERVKEIEAEIKHDVMALVRAIAEVAEDDRWIHFGATSNDIIDTAVATQLRDSIKILEIKLAKLALKLAEKAEKYRDLVCLGRTHGQAALPTTYGFRFALWASEVKRHLERLEEMKKRILVGQMSGAVGTQAAFGKEGLKIEEEVMRLLNLKPAEISSQVIPRDIYCEYVSFLAIVAATLEKIATNIRLLQRAETAEVFERFEKEKQVGSSTMPHKRNPIDSEQICGLARVIRGFVEPQYQSSILWEERDLTNSSAERIILVEATVLLDHILTKTIKVVEELGIDEKAVRENLERQRGLNMSEAVMIALTKKGMSRQQAHELLRKLSMKAYEEDKHLKEVLLEDETIRRFFSEEEIEELIKPENYLGTALERIDRVVESVKDFAKKYFE